MSSRLTAATALALLVLAAAPAARAGDLGGYPEPRSYDQEFGDRGAYPPPQGSFKDDPLPPPPRYSEYRERGPACVPHHLIRDRLVGEGWRDFQDPVLRGPVAVLRARRPSGELYVLKIDRCSGEIIGAHHARREEVEFIEPPVGIYEGPRGWRRNHWAHERRGWGRRYW